jgi:predicted nucleic acid-binding Zn ribbon protein
MTGMDDEVSPTGKPEHRTPARRSATPRSDTPRSGAPRSGAGEPAPPEAPDVPNSPSGSAPRGADLAREALAAARASTAARRKAAGRTPAASRGGAGNLRRRRWSGSGPDQRDPQPLGATLRTWITSAGAGADLKKATLFARWEKIVGPEVADHCSPVTLVDGELLVEAESTAWATQIRMLAPTLLRKINAEVGDRTVLRMRARGPAGPSWKFGYRHVSGRGPRDTYG